jgi:molecular chaperone GrpE (heat shock protein)
LHRYVEAANVGLEDQAGALNGQYLRLNADFDNFKKRTVKEKAQLAQTAKSKLFEVGKYLCKPFYLSSETVLPIK